MAAYANSDNENWLFFMDKSFSLMKELKEVCEDTIGFSYNKENNNYKVVCFVNKNKVAFNVGLFSKSVARHVCSVFNQGLNEIKNNKSIN